MTNYLLQVSKYTWQSAKEIQENEINFTLADGEEEEIRKVGKQKNNMHARENEGKRKEKEKESGEAKFQHSLWGKERKRRERIQ